MGNLIPHGPKPHEPIVTKIGIRDPVGDFYACAKFYPNPIRIAPPHKKIREDAHQSDSVTF